jgi:hypothetical protein
MVSSSSRVRVAAASCQALLEIHPCDRRQTGTDEQRRIDLLFVPTDLGAGREMEINP